MRSIFLILILALCLSFPMEAGMVDMSSTNYKIFVDVISVGGDLTNSTNYQVNSVMGEAGGVHETVSTSTNYSLAAGFQAMAGVALSATLSTNAVSLGALNVNQVVTASQTITVTTNATNGYTVTIQEDGNLRSGTDDINDVTDGAVTIGKEEYGIRTSGAVGQMNNSDTAITSSPQIVATNSTLATNEQTAITYKAAAAVGDTQSGNYSHIVTFTTVANY